MVRLLGEAVDRCLKKLAAAHRKVGHLAEAERLDAEAGRRPRHKRPARPKALLVDRSALSLYL